MKPARKMMSVTAAMLSAMLTVQCAFSAIPASAVTQANYNAFCERMRRAWENCETGTINISKYNMTLDEVADAYYDMLYTDGNWFYISSGFGYSGYDSHIFSIELRFNYDVDTISTRKAEFAAKIGEITGMLDPAWSDAEKVLFLHDYLAEHCRYDLTYSKQSYDAYSALISGSAVCQGYALAMNVLCNQIGIPCSEVTYTYPLTDSDGNV
ncbi:MAG: transglutaminase domain-containing protein, partial [Oscillospiraceae bacterium]|nr:transglutaminase domain-containing protein [Oscillospiraceae bacterium]